MTRTTAPPERPRPRLAAALIAGFTLTSAAGCGSPPSVVPLMRTVEQVLTDEAEHIEQTQALRDQQALADARQRLRDAYRADLETTPTLDPPWVESATDVYVAAREVLLQHEWDLAQQRQTRRDNLRTAARAQARAIAILQQQDRLLRQTVGLDLWRLAPPQPESQP